ncbi:DUF6174 domain-containing protein [Iningainema tapete]|uniref:Uncharacterized protein n=1 Tax=Iningainema tapete BLCC-T55 TaxID=2748662 RepID=A0A8J6XG77_9CYAN|nr:DUF6174 domain-containing protein [Iningainema tapete]MBD2773603.1 hypothetical protein [Iningainema tapete BLCC-T55]
MRLLTVIGMGLAVSLGLNAPVMSQPSVQPAQSPAIAQSNLGQLKINRRLWNQQRISNYRYILTNSCFCIPDARGPVVIEVRNGITTSITNAATGQPVNPDFFQKYDTIPKLFNLTKKAIVGGAFSVNVQYDSTLGYPTQINIDYNSQIADEEIYLSIKDLQEIP